LIVDAFIVEPLLVDAFRILLLNSRASPVAQLKVFVPISPDKTVRKVELEQLRVDALPDTTDRYPADNTLIVPSLATISLQATRDELTVLEFNSIISAWRA
jgi:hypothetical protein